MTYNILNELDSRLCLFNLISLLSLHHYAARIETFFLYLEHPKLVHSLVLLNKLVPVLEMPLPWIFESCLFIIQALILKSFLQCNLTFLSDFHSQPLPSHSSLHKLSLTENTITSNLITYFLSVFFY